MKLVIDIPDKAFKNLQFFKDESLSRPEIAVKYGIPLPKGHGDLKDADIYKTKVEKYIAENKNSDDLYLAGCGDGAYHALHIYDCIPTIIESDKEASDG